MMVPVKEGSRSIRVTFENAYNDLPLAIRIPEFRFLPAREGGSSYPEGRVGLIAAGIEQVPGMLQNLIEHFGHYKSAAEKFSESWNRDHAPSRTVAILEETRDAFLTSRNAAQ